MINQFVERDRKRRMAFFLQESNRYMLKSIVGDVHIPDYIRQSNATTLHCLEGSRAKIHNRCIVTGRPKSVYRLFRLSRLTFRRLAVAGELPGVVKSSW